MVALQRAQKPVVDTGVTNWVTTDLVTQIVPRGSTLTSAFCRLRQLVEVEGYESHAEVTKEDDQAWTGDGHKDPKANTIRNVTDACNVAAWAMSKNHQRTSPLWVAACSLLSSLQLSLLATPTLVTAHIESQLKQPPSRLIKKLTKKLMSRPDDVY